MDETAGPEPVHDLLLLLAGRVDDDLLGHARELVAVGEDGRALELLAATLAAEATVLPARVRSAVVAACRAARVDLDADAALAPPGEAIGGHRFSALAGSADPVVGALAAMGGQRLEGCEVRLAWRLTPAGAAPGPLPHPVLLVRAGAGREPDVLAYQLVTVLDRARVRASVEVLGDGHPVPAYHEAALRESTLLAPHPLADEAATAATSGVGAGGRPAGDRGGLAQETWRSVPAAADGGPWAPERAGSVPAAGPGGLVSDDPLPVGDGPTGPSASVPGGIPVPYGVFGQNRGAADAGADLFAPEGPAPTPGEDHMRAREWPVPERASEEGRAAMGGRFEPRPVAAPSTAGPGPVPRRVGVGNEAYPSTDTAQGWLSGPRPAAPGMPPERWAAAERPAGPGERLVDPRVVPAGGRAVADPAPPEDRAPGGHPDLSPEASARWSPFAADADRDRGRDLPGGLPAGNTRPPGDVAGPAAHWSPPAAHVFPPGQDPAAVATDPAGRDSAPRPLPMRPAGGRRRRVEDPAGDGPRVTPLTRTPGPAPIPVDRRDQPSPRPAPRPPVVDPDEASVPRPSRPLPAEMADTPTFAAMHDPLLGPLRQPLLDALLDPTYTPGEAREEAPGEETAAAPSGFPEAPADDEHVWAGEWASGEWAVATAAADPTWTVPPSPAPPPPTTPRETAAPPVTAPFESAPPAGTAPRETGPPSASAPRESAPLRATEPRDAAPPPATEPTAAGPPPATAPRESAPLPAAAPAAAGPSSATAPRDPAPPPATEPAAPPPAPPSPTKPPPVARRPATPPPPVPLPLAPPPAEPGDNPPSATEPATVTRLSDAHRELLARLQAELAAGRRPRVSRRAGIAGTAGTPRRDSPTPPDRAG